MYPQKPSACGTPTGCTQRISYAAGVGSLLQSVLSVHFTGVAPDLKNVCQDWTAQLPTFWRIAAVVALLSGSSTPAALWRVLVVSARCLHALLLRGSCASRKHTAAANSGRKEDPEASAWTSSASFAFSN